MALSEDVTYKCLCLLLPDECAALGQPLVSKLIADGNEPLILTGGANIHFGPVIEVVTKGVQFIASVTTIARYVRELGTPSSKDPQIKEVLAKFPELDEEKKMAVLKLVAVEEEKEEKDQ